jgi:hypothetical protein
MGVLRKKLKHAVIYKYFFFEIMINVKAGRVNALDRPGLDNVGASTSHNPMGLHGLLQG